MDTKKPVIALMYDFDKTLCTTDMQDYSFIPGLGLSPNAFWNMSRNMAEQNHMDRILAYMYLMVTKAREKNQPIRKDDLVRLGSDIELYPGVVDWFERINTYAQNQGAIVQHYIISSGLKEIIQGSVVSRFFQEIFACSFHYNEEGMADWPAVTVNYTTKTQFLFRINKNVVDISHDVELNQYIPEEDRPVPFKNMIYFGDGLTDVPCMKLVKNNGGVSVAVYTVKEKADELLRDRRVNFIAPANYEKDGDLDLLIKKVISGMAGADRLAKISRAQYLDAIKS